MYLEGAGTLLAAAGFGGSAFAKQLIKSRRDVIGAPSPCRHGRHHLSAPVVAAGGSELLIGALKTSNTFFRLSVGFVC